MKATELILVVPGAPPEQIARGVRAALAVLEAAGVEPTEAAAASLAYQMWSVGDLNGAIPATSKLHAAAVWCQARRAAVEACLNAAVPLDWPLGAELTVAPAPAMQTGPRRTRRQEEARSEEHRGK